MNPPTSTLPEMPLQPSSQSRPGADFPRIAPLHLPEDLVLAVVPTWVPSGTLQSLPAKYRHPFKGPGRFVLVMC